MAEGQAKEGISYFYILQRITHQSQKSIVFIFKARSQAMSFLKLQVCSSQIPTLAWIWKGAINQHLSSQALLKRTMKKPTLWTCTRKQKKQPQIQYLRKTHFFSVLDAYVQCFQLVTNKCSFPLLTISNKHHKHNKIKKSICISNAIILYIFLILKAQF